MLNETCTLMQTAENVTGLTFSWIGRRVARVVKVLPAVVSVAILVSRGG
jgi:hypothetical protein